MAVRSRDDALFGLAFNGRCRSAMRVSTRAIGATAITWETSLTEDEGKVARKKGEHMFWMWLVLLLLFVAGLPFDGADSVV